MPQITWFIEQDPAMAARWVPRPPMVGQPILDLVERHMREVG